MDGTGINNVQINLTGSSTTLTVTDVTGAYSFSSLPLGSTYTVTPTLSQYAFSPASRSTASIVSDVSNFNFTYGKQWNGAGSDALASNPSNWAGGVAPVPNDLVRFDATNSSKGCRWDVASVGVIELKVGFSSSVVVMTDMSVGTMVIEAGEFLMRAHEVRVGKNFSHTGGRFRANAGGTVLWNGSALQTVAMIPNSLGTGRFDSYFGNFRIDSTVRALSDLVIDGTFNISSGGFEAMSGTHTLTGGTQTGLGGAFNWDDSAGTFNAGSGQINFDSRSSGSFQLRQRSTNAFFNLAAAGNSHLTFVSNVTVNGNLNLGISGSSVTSNWGNGFAHSISGMASIGPAINTGSPTLLLGSSTMTFLSGVVVGTATLSVQSGLLNIRSSSLTVTRQGALTVPAGKTARFTFWNDTQLKLQEGTLLLEGSSIFSSSAPGSARFSTSFNGTVNIQSATVMASMNADGFHMGAGAVVTNLKQLDFQNGVTGGTAFNFNPVSQSNVTIDSPKFDVTFSTNVRAIINTSITPTADIDVIDSTGAVSGSGYEYDPDGIVNWGTLGSPINFSGAQLGISSITWSWTKVNHPTGFFVLSSTGGTLSPSLNFGTTYWVEVGLSTNTSYTRSVRAFTDFGQSDSAAASRYTSAISAASFVFTNVNVTSMTMTWALNGNPAQTIFVLERSTNDVTYVELASGTTAALTPYTDTDLIDEKLYYYRVKTVNGDGVFAPGSVKASTTTAPVPAPIISGISPSTVSNLGNTNFLITGSFFQTGAILRLKNGSKTSTPLTIAISTPSSITTTINTTGMTAGLWSVEIENTDGKISVGSGIGILTVTDAVSATPVFIQTFVSTSGMALTTSAEESFLSVAAGAMPSGRIYLSVNPEDSPLTVDPTVIDEANAALSGLILVPGSLREVLAYNSQGIFSTGFLTPVSLGIKYPDTDGDGIVDSISMRVAGLKLITLNESTHLWELVSGSSIDATQRRVSVSLSHFSVYALAASPAFPTLSEAKVYPSPWKRGSLGEFDANQITLENLTDGGTIRIYSLGAELIKEIHYETSDIGQMTWDGKDGNGELIKSGVYLINIKSSSGETKTLKWAVER